MNAITQGEGTASTDHSVSGATKGKAGHVEAGASDKIVEETIEMVVKRTKDTGV